MYVVRFKTGDAWVEYRKEATFLEARRAAEKLHRERGGAEVDVQFHGMQWFDAVLHLPAKEERTKQNV